MELLLVMRNLIRYNLFAVFIISLLVSLISFEIYLKYKYPLRYLTYSYINKYKRFVVNGVESIGCGIYSKSNYYAYKLIPNINVNIIDKYYNAFMSVKTNDDGFTFSKPDDFKENIIVIGDSMTFGYGTKDYESYPKQLEKLLGNQYNVLNFGVPSWGFGEYYLTYKRYVNQFNPKLIVLGILFSADFNRLFYSTWPGKEKGILPCPPLIRRDINIDKFNQLKNNSIIYKLPILRESSVFIFFIDNFLSRVITLKNVIQDKLSQVSTEEMSLKIIADMAKNHNFLILLMPTELECEDETALHNVDNYIDKLHHIKLIHILNLYPAMKREYKNLYIDGMHYNMAGNLLVANQIYEVIEKQDLLHNMPN